MRPELASVRAVSRGEAAGTSYSVYAPQSEDARATVVLIHGVGMNQTVWSPQIGALTTSYRVVVYDMLGHGDSALPTAAPTLEEYASQLKALLDAMHIERAHVVGHSMGALVALEFALRYPQRTLSVVTLNAVYDRTPAQREAVMTRAATLGDVLDAGVDATLSRWFGDPVPGHLTQAAQAVRGLLLSVDPVGYARTYRLFARSDDAHVGRLAGLAVPALFLTGECDPNSSPAMSRAMAAATPSGRAEIIANERHMMNVTDPEGVNERLLAFFAETPAEEAPHESINGERHD
ncbi:alpha/beta fold hydrolase [Paraburkholderia saeva]|uniref:(E)-2-((N-methylformamido)methylene)succinate hydrolase n=1 Tax=Paraburkholderia saeva TaxID=2777537 RepID=A0A9N8RW83_9BURK|nr:alpha/beta hydrolase [Paraburkholderia saeva]CAG4887315.1 (E)-2-((N-methylformamido)methylene)succinate hydrolase [Paraburkholderia saeva]CAG4894871.1 (E)-2-((N-methylformamido)methylene)succinate hydrolase [Paraburkholderia saeva]